MTNRLKLNMYNSELFYNYNHIGLVENDLTIRVLPGFGPDAEAVLFRQKDPKRLPPRPAFLD